MALLLNAGDTVSRSYSYTQPSPLHPSLPQGTGERTGNLFDDFDIVGQVPSVNNGNLVNSALGGTTSFIKMGSAEIVLSYNAIANIYLFLYDNDSQFIGYIQKTNGEPIYSTSISGYSNAVYCRVRVDILVDFSNANLMLNLGSTALPYEPYGYKIPISSANTTTPVYLGEVQTTRKIKKLVFDGTENWTITANKFYYITLSSYPINRLAAITSHFEVRENISATGCARFGGTASAPQNTFIFNYDNGAGGITSWKSYLAAQYSAGTPVTVWYVLAEPETGIINEPLRKIGDYADTLSMEQAGVQIPTLHGNTTIDVETELKPSEMYIKYKG